ncbi:MULTISPECIES: tetratricopeptide repeat protein [Nostocales]|uniref:Tetratricopeptide repeat protein n=3 Tax=Nostocales TaxID=1161 RepID=A0A8S9SWS4_9CYAN|nr:tetratricopeptide repeat protein [Tolypothrix bouteillei]KAF3883844.1 tetratricopeptide repeat protein [Tolypothrix bouteillei VB521301]
MQYVLYSIAFYVLLIVLTYFITFLQLCKSRLQYPKYQLEKANTVPTYRKELFQASIKELEEFGFQPCSYLLVQPMVRLDPPTTYELLLYHKAYKTYAIVSVRRPAETVNLFDIEFFTFFRDESLLLTMNGKGYNVLGDTPNVIIQDAYTTQTSIQWQTHENKLNQLAAKTQPWGIAPNTFTKALEKYIKNYVDCLLKKKEILPIDGSNLFRLHWLVALKITKKTVQGANKASSLVAQRKQQAKTNSILQVEIPVELEVEQFQWMESQQKGLLGGKLRTWLLLGSLVLFIVSYTKLFATQSLIIFIGVLFFHEGGHLLAMKFFGYQDASMLFLPFLGAVATARKDDATLAQKFWISLAGPLPGLILGVGLAIASRNGGYPSWVIETAWMSIGLNLFNLLPIYPLDGGQIANLLLFCRFPYTDVLFKIFGTVVLGLLAISQPGFLLLVLVVLVSIPSNFRTAKVNAQLQQELKQQKPTSQENLLHSIFKKLKHLGYGNLSFGTRYTLAKNLLERHYEAHTKGRTVFFLSLVYCSSLLAGIAGSLSAITPNWLMATASLFEAPETIRKRAVEVRKQEIESATTALRLNPKNTHAYIRRAQARLTLRDYKGAVADYNSVVQLNPNNIPHRLTRANFHLTLQNYKSAIQDYDWVLSLNPNDSRTYRRRAQARNLSGDYKGAVTDYSTVIKLNPENFLSYLERGQIYLQLKDYKAALADANSALKIDSKQPEAYELRSQARRYLGDRQGAIADEQMAQKLYQASEGEEAI